MLRTQRPRRILSHVLVFVMLGAAPAFAIRWPQYEDRELVHKAEAVVEGTITAIIPAPGVEGKGRPGVSVAVVKVKTVFKGGLKEDGEFRLVYWSREGSTADMWFRPEKYGVGETLVFPLQRKHQAWLEQFDASPAAAQADWVTAVRRDVYGEQVQSWRFRSVAAVWADPAKHLVGERRPDAIFFLAVQGKLEDKMLLQLLAAADLDDQLSGCRAARHAKSRSALAPLTELVETYGALAEHWRGNRGRTGGPDRSKVYEILRVALAAVTETPFDPKADAPLLLRLALTGRLSDGMVFRILHAGPARAEVSAGLLKEMDRAPRAEPLKVLFALDARAAYVPLRKLASPIVFNKPLEASRLVQEYESAWAKRFALDFAAAPPLGWHASDQFGFVRRVFGFTHKPVDPDELRKNADQKPDTWESRYAELRKAAEEQLSVFEKEGPSFAELSKRLEGIRWEAYRPSDGTSAEFGQTAHAELTRLIIAHADPRAKDLNPAAQAEWLVDLYSGGYWGYPHLPWNQLWVAADGTFGLGWLPDRAWGKSAELAAFLKRALP